MAPSIPEIRGSALWHLYDYDVDAGSFVLRRVEEAGYRDASFLDQRIESKCKTAFRYQLEHLEKLFPAHRVGRGATMFIFHIGHSGSTLLSRALDVDRAVLPVREPLPLRHLAQERRHLNAHQSPDAACEEAWSSRFFTVLQALSRSFRAGQLPIVKATSTCNNLVLPVLRENPQPRAVMMYVRLETWLAGMLGKQQAPLDLRGHAQTRMRDWKSLNSAAEFDMQQLGEAELAVLSWLTSMHPLIEAGVKLPERTLLLDFEDFLEHPWSGLAGTAGFFGLSDHSEAMLAQWSEVSRGYSKKPDHPYTPAHRQRTLQRGHETRGGEISRGIAWAEKLISLTPVLSRCGEYLH